jgi:hypothetical protein
MFTALHFWTTESSEHSLKKLKLIKKGSHTNGNMQQAPKKSSMLETLQTQQNEMEASD